MTWSDKHSGNSLGSLVPREVWTPDFQVTSPGLILNNWHLKKQNKMKQNKQAKSMMCTESDLSVRYIWSGGVNL